jgi:hypothetical protein
LGAAASFTLTGLPDSLCPAEAEVRASVATTVETIAVSVTHRRTLRMSIVPFRRWEATTGEGSADYLNLKAQ